MFYAINLAIEFYKFMETIASLASLAAVLIGGVRSWCRFFVRSSSLEYISSHIVRALFSLGPRFSDNISAIFLYADRLYDQASPTAQPNKLFS